MHEEYAIINQMMQIKLIFVLLLILFTTATPIAESEKTNSSLTIQQLTPQLRHELFVNLTASNLTFSSVVELGVLQELGQYYLQIDQLATINRLNGTKKGWFSFVNVLWFVSIITGIPAASMIFVSYLLPLIFLIPALIWEVLGYTILSVILTMCYSMENPVTKDYVALTACLSILPLLSFSQHLHDIVLMVDWKEDEVIRKTSFVLFVFWASVAWTLPSNVVGAIAVIALVSYLGFSVAVQPFTVYIGFSDQDSIHRCMSACLMLMVLSLVTRLMGWHLIDPFIPGIDLLCVFAFHIGNLIISTGNYIAKDTNHQISQLNQQRREVALAEGREKEGEAFDENVVGWNFLTDQEAATIGANHARRYQWQQFLTLLSFFLTLMVGNVLDISTYRNIGATIGTVWLLEKYIEFTWRRGGMLWSTFGLSVLVWCISFVIQSHPSYFFLGDSF
jgi:hypothetical protein